MKKPSAPPSLGEQDRIRRPAGRRQLVSADRSKHRRRARRGRRRRPPRLPRARASRPNRPGCRPASASRRRARASPSGPRRARRSRAGRTRWSTSGWRRKMPVAEQGASSRIASTGAGGDQRHDVGGDDLAPRARCAARFSESRARRLSDTSTARHLEAGRGELHRLAARRGAQIERASGPRRRRAGGPGSRRRCPAPTSRLRHSRSRPATAVPAGRRRWPGSRLTPSMPAGGSSPRRRRGRAAAARRAAGGGLDRPPRPRPRASAPRPRPAGSAARASVAACAHHRAEHAVDQPARAAVDQRQHGRDGGMGRRAQRQRLDERDAQREARLGVVGQALARWRGRSARRDRAGGAASRRRWRGRGRGRRAGRGRAPRVSSAASSGRPLRSTASSSRSAARRAAVPAGSAPRRSARSVAPPERVERAGAAAARRRQRGGGACRPASSAIASSAAIRFSVAGWVENRLSPRPRPGTM